VKNYKSNEPCVACGYYEENAICYHHLRTRAAKGCDSDFNLVSLCAFHHTEIHKIGTNSFAEKYKNFEAFLINHGYEKDELTNKWVRYEK
jgi:hypothetical protein